ncbi:MAG: hypothetical protein U5Q16_01515, partial [Gammaproteobacteria bacterium]|nr:hypothetical protein [Gammaproteobacteria bacterium]
MSFTGIRHCRRVLPLAALCLATLCLPHTAAAAAFITVEDECRVDRRSRAPSSLVIVSGWQNSSGGWSAATCPRCRTPTNSGPS